MTNNTLQIRTTIIDLITQEKPRLVTSLNHNSPFQLLIATILSAQCTDERVNLITEKLFALYPTLEALVQLPLSQLEEHIQSAGLWRTKARNIQKTCRVLIEEFHGQVPQTLPELVQLPGVGRKTANVVLANAFHIPALPVDTHVHRVANRLGLAASKTPEETENQLMLMFPKEYWNDVHHWMINHGREICHARRPACTECLLANLCPARS